jgi:lipopolysaccharide biosynthesis glycosyltransferase
LSDAVDPEPGVLHVSCAAEGGYVPHSAAMLHSVLVNAAIDVHIHYLHGPELPASSQTQLSEMVTDNGGEISFHEIPDEQCAGLATTGFTRKATWYRIFLPGLLASVDRVLYLDSDLLVLDSLEPLARVDLSDHYVGAVTNVFQPEHLYRPGKLGLSDPRDYFNAGVMLLNLDLLRRQDSTRALFDYGLAHAGDKLAWRDQDAVNVVLGGRRRTLAPRWNCMNAVLNFPWSPYVFGIEQVEEARLHPAIRHFEGPGINKPWHYLCEKEMQDLYADHRRHTPWPDYRRDGRTAANFTRRAWRSLCRRTARLRRPIHSDPSLLDRDALGIDG